MGTLSVADDSSIRLSDGATLTFADSSAAAWESGKTVTVFGDPEKCVLRFGSDANALTSAQQRSLRWNGRRCHLLENGTVDPSPRGLSVIVR